MVLLVRLLLLPLLLLVPMWVEWLLLPCRLRLLLVWLPLILRWVMRAACCLQGR